MQCAILAKGWRFGSIMFWIHCGLLAQVEERELECVELPKSGVCLDDADTSSLKVRLQRRPTLFSSQLA